MRRLRKHQRACNKLLALADDRLSGDRRALIELISLYIDAEGAEKDLFRMLLLSEFLASAKTLKLKVNNPNDPGVSKEEVGKLERETTEEIRKVFAIALREESDEPVSSD